MKKLLQDAKSIKIPNGERAVPHYNLRILGPPSIESDSGDVTPRRQKSLAILIYLTTTGRKISRNDLASLFWPDSHSSKALGALRTALADIHSSLGSEIFIRLRDYIEVDLNAVKCDALIFRELRSKITSTESLEKAVKLWNGGFLKGFDLKGTPLFTDWQYLEEQNLEQDYRRILNRLSLIFATENKDNKALDYRRKIQELDPYDEENHREIMKLHIKMGDKNSALRQFKTCRKYLEDDLGFPLEEETSSLVEEIRAGKYSYAKSIGKPLLNMDNNKPRMAALPFQCQGQVDKDQIYLGHIASEAMTEICSLQKEIEVISQTSTLTYGTRDKNISRIAAELKADYIIVNVLVMSDSNMILEGRLVKAASDSIICSEHVECLPTETGAAYGSIELAARLLKTVDIVIESSNERERDPGLPWRLYGHSQLKQSAEELQENAIKSFYRALKLNRKDAAAWSGIALSKICLCNVGFLGADTEKLYSEAEDACAKALDLDPREPTALYVSGCLAEDYHWDYELAEELYMRAILSDPANPRFYQGCSSVLIRKGKLAEAIEMAEKSYRIDPASMWSISAKYWALVAARQYRKASRMVEEAQIFFHHVSWNGFDKALMHLYLKNYDLAAKAMEEIHDQLLEEKKETLLFAQAYAYGALGRKKEAMEIVSIMIDGRTDMIGFSYPVAAVHTVLGNHKKAISLIEWGIENHDPGVLFLVLYPFYDTLYTFPQFRDQMKRAGFEAWL